CPKCGKPGLQQDWCRKCESRKFKKLSKWTSGNEYLDKLIKYTQNKAYGPCSFWEWIPYEKFSDIQYLSKGGFGTMFVANWVDGPRDLWDYDSQQYVRNKNCKVALKRLDDDIINSGFVNELRSYYCRAKTRCDYAIRIYGISREPETNSYIIVMPYYHKGDLRTILRERKTELTWQEKFQILYSLSNALKDIHLKGHTHCNLHPGNIFQVSQDSSVRIIIGDLGMNKSACRDPTALESYGVVPYVASETLRSWPYTQASDIYSFGMIMWELSSGKPPFLDRAHDEHLVFEVCEGLRPDIVEGTPKCYVELMRKCWNDEPSNRPRALEIYQIIQSWDNSLFRSIDEELSSISESSDEEVNVHPEAIYSSKPLSGIITQGFGLESTLSQDNPRKSIVFKNSEIQDTDKIKELIPKKKHRNLANNDIPTIEIHKYDSEPSDEEKD
ncbi:9751_t:CDS:2, partial [Dentiscutata heterogama]